MPAARGQILFIPHGAGPLPLLNDPAHQSLVEFLQTFPQQIHRPDAIIVISAHWEQPMFTLSMAAQPALIYDYAGFPPASYQIQYPAPGDPALAQRCAGSLKQQGIDCRLDADRGFDHGLFVPLKLMYPQADIPCIQISLQSTLNAEAHIDLGKALQPLLKENIMILGSGFSFHNMRAFFQPMNAQAYQQNIDFEQWLINTCRDRSLTQAEREKRLVAWQRAPSAHYCHPREEHLLPLHVCLGAAGQAATLVFEGDVCGVRSCAFYWSG